MKDRLAASESDEVAESREEIEDLEARIEEISEFQLGSGNHTRSTRG